MLLIMVNVDILLEVYVPTSFTVIPFCSGFYRHLELHTQCLPFLDDQVNPAEFKVECRIFQVLSNFKILWFHHCYYVQFFNESLKK